MAEDITPLELILCSLRSLYMKCIYDEGLLVCSRRGACAAVLQVKLDWVLQALGASQVGR